MQALSDSEIKSGYIALANTIGHSVLIHTLEMAAHYLTHSANQQRKTRFYIESEGCYAFIQGTGLDTLMQSYGLNYDSDNIRNGFFYCLKRSV